MDMSTIFKIDIFINDIVPGPNSPAVYYDELSELSKKPSRKKIIFSSPLWIRDDTHRLKRKSIRRSTSLQSITNENGGQKLTKTDTLKNTVLNSTPLRITEMRRMPHKRRTLVKNQLMPWHNLNQNSLYSTI